MSVKPVELIKQPADRILSVCVCLQACVCIQLCVCACMRAAECLCECAGKTICQCFDSHVTRRGSVSGDPEIRTTDYPPMHDSYIYSQKV